MEEIDIQNVATIMLEADGGCSTCAARLLQELLKLYPQFENAMDSVYRKEYDSDFKKVY